MLETPGKAVFLSYASQDAEAARRIADALRGFEIEVWFDQHELRGGDAWDQKIRKQIQECTLFLPIISTTTQERREGYFRREWKLAADRTNDMAEGAPFIVPVAMDDIPQSTAAVPEQFLRVQWTRLTHGVPTPEFVAQVKRLLETPWRPGAAGTRSGGGGPVSVAPRRRLMPWVAGAAAVVLTLVGYFALRQPVKEVAVTRLPVADTKPAAAHPNGKSIAVLPFKNHSPDPANAFFTDGVHEDILTRLCNIRDLHVIARTSVEQYRGTTKTIGEIGTELGVTYVLEGSVRRIGNQVRLTSLLIKARTEAHLWAKSYDREISDIFSIQSALAQEIAGALQAVLTPDEKTRLDLQPTRNTEAYDQFLRARELIRRSPGERAADARALLESAVKLDPQFAAAWAQLCSMRVKRFFGTRDPKDLDAARKTMEAALAVAPDDVDVRRAVGDYHYYGLRDYGRATAEYARCIRIQPNDADTILQLGAIERRQGRWIEAIASFRQSSALDPGNTRPIHALAETLQQVRRYGESRAQYQRLRTLRQERSRVDYLIALLAYQESGSTEELLRFQASLSQEEADSALGQIVRYHLAVVSGRDAERELSAKQTEGSESFGVMHEAFFLAARGDLAGARAHARDLPAQLRHDIELNPVNDILWARLAAAEALLGNKSEALSSVRRAIQLLPESLDAYDGPRHGETLAFVYAWTGDKERAIAEYGRLLNIPSWLNVHEMKTAARFLPLRGDPRWEALLNDPKNNAPLF